MKIIKFSDTSILRINVMYTSPAVARSVRVPALFTSRTAIYTGGCIIIGASQVRSRPARQPVPGCLSLDSRTRSARAGSLTQSAHACRITHRAGDQ